MQHLEMKLEKISLKRVDADVMDKLIEKEDEQKHQLTEDETKKLKEIFEKAINNTNMKVEVESLCCRRIAGYHHHGRMDAPYERHGTHGWRWRNEFLWLAAG